MADEYIRKEDAKDALQEKVFHDLTDEFYGAMQVLDELEPADVAPIVRCGLCEYWQDNDGDYGYCYAKDGQGFGHAWGKNDFCSYGEREG